MTTSPTPLSKFSTRQVVLVGLTTAITCMVGPIVIPIPVSPVPLSLTNLAVNLIVYALGMRLGTVNCLLYLLLGMVGFPVFSGYSGGLAKLAGPTGGYLIGFIFQAMIAGFFIEKFPGRIRLHFAGMLLGMACCNFLGTMWLSMQMNISSTAALGAGVLPYLPGDIVKIMIAAMMGPVIKHRLRQIYY